MLIHKIYKIGSSASLKNCMENYNFINLRIIVKNIINLRIIIKRGSKNNNGYIYAALQQFLFYILCKAY